MKRSKWALHLLLLLVLEFSFAADVLDEVDERYKVDLPATGRSFRKTRQFIQYLLKNCNLIPGKNVEFEINPPDGSQFELTEDIVSNLEEILPSFIDTPDTSFKLVATEDDRTNEVKQIKLGLIGGFLKNIIGNGISAIKRISKAFLLRIHSLGENIRLRLKEILRRISYVFYKHSKGFKAVGFTITLDLPKGTTVGYVQNAVLLLKEELRKKIDPADEFTISENMLQTSDGYVKKVEFLITLFYNTNKNRKSFEIDLTTQQNDVEKFIKRLFARLEWTNEGDECTPIDLKVKTTFKSKTLFQKLKKIIDDTLMKLVPGNNFQVTLQDPQNSTENGFGILIGCGEPTNRKSRSPTVDLQTRTLFPPLKEMLPNVIFKLEERLKTTNLASLRFRMPVPPLKGYPYVKLMHTELLKALKKKFKECFVFVTSSPEYGTTGFLTDINFDLMLECRRPNVGIELFIDFTRLNLNMISELRTFIINTLPKINFDLKSNNSAFFTLKVKPPIHFNSADFSSNMQKVLTTQLKTYFPFCEITLTSRNIEDYILFDISLKTSNIDTNKLKTISIDLKKPGVSLQNEILDILEKQKTYIQDSLKNGTAASLNLLFELPPFTNPQYMENIIQQILPWIQKYFPEDKIELKSNQISDTAFIVNLNLRSRLDSDQSLVAEITLKNPKEWETEMRSILPKLPGEIVSNLDKGIPQHFQIAFNSPKSSNIEFGPNILEEMKKIIDDRFPRSSISIKAKIEPSAVIDFKKIVLDILIKPGKKAPQISEKFIINATDESLNLKISKFLEKIETDAKNDLSNGTSVGLTFDLQFSENTRLTDLEIIESSILSEIIKYFPDLQIDTNRVYIKDIRKFITNAEIQVTIHPRKRNEDLKRFRFPKKFELEFPDERTPVNVVLENVIPKLFSIIQGNSKNDTIYTIDFEVKPPKGSNDKFIYSISGQIVNELSKYFPEFLIESISTSLKKNGTQKILLVVNLTPGKKPGLLSNEPPALFMLNIKDNRENFADEITLFLKKDLKKISEKLRSSKPVMIMLKIKPPPMSKGDYKIEKLRKIKELLINLFGSRNNIRYEVREIEDEHGIISSLDIVIKIEKKSGGNHEPDDSIYDGLEIKPGDKPKDKPVPTEEPPVTSNTQRGPLTNDKTDSVTKIAPTEPMITETPQNTAKTEKPTPPTKEEPVTKPENPTTSQKPTPQIVVRSKDDITSVIESFYRDRIFDIQDNMNKGNIYTVQLLMNDVGGSEQNMTDIMRLIRNVFDGVVSNGIIKMESGSSGSKSIVTVYIEPPMKKEMEFKLDQDDNKTNTEIFRHVYEPLKKMALSLKKNEKAEITIRVFNPLEGPPDTLILKIVEKLNQMMRNDFSDLEYKLDVSTSDRSVFLINILMKKSDKLEQPQKDSTYFRVMIPKDGSSWKKRIDGKLSSLYPMLKTFISENKIVMVMDMELSPEEANDNSVTEIMNYLKTSLNEEIPNVSIGIKPYWSPTRSNMALLEVTIDSYPNDSSIPTIPLDLDLSTPTVRFNEELGKLVARMTPEVKKVLSKGQPALLKVNILAPNGTKDHFMLIVHNMIIPSLTSPFCGNNNQWLTNYDVDFNGFLKNISISIIYKPSQNKKNDNQKNCEENIDIDLSRPDIKLNEEFDRIFSTIFNKIQLYLNQRKKITLNFELKLPLKPDHNFLQQTMDSLMDIVMNYFPFHLVKIQVVSSFHGAFASLKITIEQEKNPLPQADLEIPIDLSQGNNVKLYLKHILSVYQPQIDVLTKSDKPFVLGFRIIPPKGANERDYENIPMQFVDVLREISHRRTINVKSKFSKNSKGEYSQFLIAITFK